MSESGNSLGLFDTTGVEGFASWYVTPEFSLSARYRTYDVGYIGLILLNPRYQGDADQERTESLRRFASNSDQEKANLTALAGVTRSDTMQTSGLVYFL